MHLIVFQILTVLLDGDAVAKRIIQRLARLNEGDAPSLATFYRHLKTGIDEGWIEIVGDESEPHGRGRPQQQYRVTASGTRAATVEAKRLRALSDLALGKMGGR